jgi:outer membrane protein TolC
LKRLSDVDLLRLQADFQEARSRRFVSEARQRRARSRLAIAMGRPDDLVSGVVPPQMPDTGTGLADYETLVRAALDSSAALRALQAAVDAARDTLAAERARGGLLITAEAEAAWYQRPTGSTHPLGAGLLLELPFDTDGAKRAAVALARARLTQAEAELALARQELRQEVLELWQLLDAKRVELEELAVLQDYRELYLDRSRALYELEVKSDLGDAMTQISAVRLRQGEAQFEWLMAKARLDALAGQLLIEDTEL